MSTFAYALKSKRSVPLIAPFALMSACLYPSYRFDLSATEANPFSGGNGGSEEGKGAAGAGTGGHGGLAGNSAGGQGGVAGNLVGGQGGVGGNPSGGQGGASNPCQSTVDRTVLYVHASRGSDGNNGACEQPFRTIKQAMSVAENNLTVETIHLFGNPAGSPRLVYSAATNQETFPIQPSRTSLTIEGDGQDQVELSGSGACLENRPCAVRIAVVNTRLRQVTVKNPAGAGISIEQPTTIEQTNIESCDGDGIIVSMAGYQTARINNSVITNNANGIKISSRGQGNVLALNATSVIKNHGDGIVDDYNTTLQLVGNTIASNGVDGIGLGFFTDLTSLKNTIEKNGNAGVRRWSGGKADGLLSFTGDNINNNQQNGIHLSRNGSQFRMRDSTVLGNGGMGLFFDGEANDTNGTIDLGTASSPGGNTFQSTSRPNGGVGICNKTATPIADASNHWRQCPPQSSGSCTGAVDVGGTTLPTTTYCHNP